MNDFTNNLPDNLTEKQIKEAAECIEFVFSKFWGKLNQIETKIDSLRKEVEQEDSKYVPQ